MRRLGKGGISAYLWRSRRHAACVKAHVALAVETWLMIGEKSAEVIVVGLKRFGELL